MRLSSCRTVTRSRRFCDRMKRGQSKELMMTRQRTGTHTHTHTRGAGLCSERLPEGGRPAFGEAPSRGGGGCGGGGGRDRPRRGAFVFVSRFLQSQSTMCVFYRVGCACVCVCSKKSRRKQDGTVEKGGHRPFFGARPSKGNIQGAGGEAARQPPAQQGATSCPENMRSGPRAGNKGRALATRARAPPPVFYFSPPRVLFAGVGGRQDGRLS